LCSNFDGAAVVRGHPELDGVVFWDRDGAGVVRHKHVFAAVAYWLVLIDDVDEWRGGAAARFVRARVLLWWRVGDGVAGDRESVVVRRCFLCCCC